jgi:cytidylate kinase
MVIVGRGGQAILKNKTNVLHVRIVAPLDFRVEYLMMDRGVTRDAALRIISDSDRAQSEFLQKLYGINVDDPVNYHIVLNSASVNIEMAVKAVAFACSPNKKLLSKLRGNK